MTERRVPMSMAVKAVTDATLLDVDDFSPLKLKLRNWHPASTDTSCTRCDLTKAALVAQLAVYHDLLALLMRLHELGRIDILLRYKAAVCRLLRCQSQDILLLRFSDNARKMHELAL